MWLKLIKTYLMIIHIMILRVLTFTEELDRHDIAYNHILPIMIMQIIESQIRTIS